MTAPDLIGLFIEPLERTGLSYMVTGGVASVIYGDPRFTRDIDVVLDLAASEAEQLLQVFDAREFYVPPLEVLKEEAGRDPGGHFNIIHTETALRADVYLAGRDRLHAWAFDRRHRVSLDAGGIWVAPPEYVVLRKLQYYSESGSDRHLRDIAMMLRISEELFNQDSLQMWAAELDLTELLEQARRYQP